MQKNNSNQDYTNQKIKELYEKYAEPILIFLYRCTKDHHLALDLLQDTFLNFIKIFSHTDIIDELKAKIYLFKTAKNLYINNYRKLKKQTIVQYDDTIQQYNIDPEKETLQKEELKDKEKILNELLEHLNYYEKTIVILRYNLDFKLEEIADIMGKSVSSISRNLQNIQKKLLKIAKEKKFI